MKASLLLMAFLCLNSQSLKAQEQIVQVQQDQPAVAPQIALPAPIEVDVPVYEPRDKLPAQPIKAEVQKVYTQIKDSQFFLEINPMRFSSSSTDFESNNQDMYSRPDLELDDEDSQFKMLPLNFKFGFNNENWGSFAEIAIRDSSNSSTLTVYARLSSVRLGAGLQLDLYSGETKIKSNGVLVAKGTSDKTQVFPYFYMAFDLINSDSVHIEQWNKVGGSYSELESGSIKINGVSFVIRPALDIMFKINPKLQIGTGAEFQYERFSGKIERNGSKFSGVGNYFEVELNIIKTKFIF